LFWAPTAIFLLDKTCQSAVVEGPDLLPAAFTRHKLFTNCAGLRAPGQVYELGFRVQKAIWIVGHSFWADRQSRSNSVPVGQQPGFYGPNRYAKAHMFRRSWKPVLQTFRSTRTVTIEVNNNDPWRKPSGVVVAAKALQQFLLALSSMNSTQP
jgi:hypothetical protein